MEKPTDGKVAAVGAPDITKTPEYRKFKAMLRKVIKAPPLPRKKVIDLDRLG
jgi:hypothetical protein